MKVTNKHLYNILKDAQLNGPYNLQERHTIQTRRVAYEAKLIYPKDGSLTLEVTKEGEDFIKSYNPNNSQEIVATVTGSLEEGYTIVNQSNLYRRQCY